MLRARTAVPAVSLAALGFVFACSSADRADFGAGLGPGADGGETPEGATTERPGEQFTETDASPIGDATVAICAPSPEHVEIAGNNCDDDGDGQVDNVTACDDALPKDGTAAALAKSLGLCHAPTATADWGLVSAELTRGFGRTDAPKVEQGGVLPKFGNVVKPREGQRLGVLSTGFADEYNGAANAPFGGTTGSGLDTVPNGKDWWSANGTTSTGKLPPGFPKPANGCTQSNVVNDVVNLKLTVKAPKNVKGFAFDFNFYSGEWPAYVCSRFNDGFLAYLSAKGFNGGTADNVSFDAMGNPVSVNNGFFDRCTTGVQMVGCASGAPKNSNCAAGPDELGGTGFGQVGEWCGPGLFGPGPKSTNGGATGWLSTTAPVEAGETFTLELMIWDTGDGLLDSSVLLDNFRWIEGNVQAGTVRPPR